MNRLSTVFAAVLLIMSAAVLPAQEYILVSGGVSLYRWEKFKAQPHDLWWLNFIRAARLRIQQIRAEKGPDAMITWLVYAPAYRTRSAQEGKDLLADISSVRSAYGVKLIFFNTTRELIDYLNAGQPRDRVPICGFEFFGHSNRACLMFDYSNIIDSASKVWLHEDELRNIRRGIFTRDAYLKTWGCHCGESFVKKWKAATGVPMYGAIGKTQYHTDTLPTLSSPGGRWVR